MLTDRKISVAVSKIAQRAERITNDSKVVQTYVEVGILPQILNFNNQIIYGRRGTGKTHLFRYLENELKNEKTNFVIYIDCRTLGSAADYNNDELPLQNRCISLFKDIVSTLCDNALHFIAEKQEILKNANKAYNALDEISLSIKSDSLEVNSEGKNEKIQFPDLNKGIKSFINHTNAQIYFLIDEWSSIPIEIQPYFAEFFKRSFLPISHVTIKIAALEYRSNFTIQKEKNNHIGFELGSDLSINLDLDDYFVFDRNPETITNSFSEILFKHVLNELEEGYLHKEYNIKNGKDFIKKVLTDSNNFQELVRASEGVVRDMLNIFTLAFFEALKQDKSKIDKKSIVESSRQWFERDKAQNLDDKLSLILRKIVDEVIGKKRARSFLIPKELERHENIQRLFDARVIHLIKRGYADKDNPGNRYNVFGLDYGTYVDLLTTNKKPELEMLFIDERIEEKEEFIVPFDDKRSIRRIILTDEILS